MLMCLWVIRETSRCGPDILSDERKCDPAAFAALKSTKHQFGSAVLECVKLKWTLISKPQKRHKPQSHHQVCGLKWACTGFFRAVWPISPGRRMSGRLGRPSWETSVVLRLHVTWLSSHTTSYASVTAAMPEGESPPPIKTVDPPLDTQLRIHRHTRPRFSTSSYPKSIPS